jgi:hypothetical protein
VLAPPVTFIGFRTQQLPEILILFYALLYSANSSAALSLYSRAQRARDSQWTTSCYQPAFNA